MCITFAFYLIVFASKHNSHSYAESKNVDIRGQTDFVNSLDSNKIFAPKASTFHEQMIARGDPFMDTIRGGTGGMLTSRQRRAHGHVETTGTGTGAAARTSRTLMSASQFQAQYQSTLPSGISPNDLKQLLKYHHEYVVSSSIQECHLLVCHPCARIFVFRCCCFFFLVLFVPGY